MFVCAHCGESVDCGGLESCPHCGYCPEDAEEYERDLILERQELEDFEGLEPEVDYIDDCGGW